MEKNYLESILKQFEYYKQLGEKAMEQLEEKQLFEIPSKESNSIAVIVQHLSGNMLSRWTDFLTTDGEKEWRRRDEEFEQAIATKAELLKEWNKGWEILFSTLRSLRPEDLSKIVYIRNQGCTVVDAINRQLAHYPYHIGQMVYVAKLLVQHDWRSLSIARNQSKAYNSDKFSQERSMKHFTDEYLKKGKNEEK